ncbi:MAG: hypothetical protein CAF45_004895 [Nitrospira sp. CG24E]|nr:MAG: hypothetical protein CAF45_004895 [Nitrospira sp. CG24E]
MEPTHSRKEIAEFCDRFEAAVQRELELARQEQHWLYELGLAHNEEVSLSSQLRNGRESLHAASPGMDELLGVVTTRRQSLDHQQTMVGILAATLDRTRTNKKQAASEVADHYRSLMKHAHATLKERYGKIPSRFSLWRDTDEAELSWCIVTLNQLLSQVQNRIPGSLAALRHLLSGEPFRLRVMRGFFVRVDQAMKEICPTDEGVAYQVPQDLPKRDAFEAILTGRAELC